MRHQHAESIAIAWLVSGLLMLALAAGVVSLTGADDDRPEPATHVYEAQR